MAEIVDIGPHKGPQEDSCASAADIVIYGGAAGGGKSFGLILETLRHIDNPGFGGVIFRRTSPELTGAGSLWSEARQIYPLFGGRMKESPNLEVQFPSGAALQFLHLQHLKDIHSHQGKQYAFVGFDELTHFLAAQFWYLISRMRSVAGIDAYMRCTTNPDPDSFVRDLIDWWIGADGTPIQERSGALRWMARQNDALFWADTKDELVARFGKHCDPKSLTFIAARLEDNPTLTTADPGYRGRLMVLPEVEKERLLEGNWDVRPSAGKYIKAEYFNQRWEKQPKHLMVYIASDYAVTDPDEEDVHTEPDYTEHGVFGLDQEGKLYVLDWWFGQTSADVWIEALLDLVDKWKPHATFGESGQIRRAVEPFLKRRKKERRSWCRFEWIPSTKDKTTRARPFQAMAASGCVIFPKASWAERVVRQCVSFPSARFDDAFDVMSKMCQAIDMAHAAVVPSGKRPRKPRDYGRGGATETDWSAL